MRLRSIRSKLLFSFVAVILLPLFTLGILDPYLSARTLENEATSYTQQLIRQATRNIPLSMTPELREAAARWLS